MKQFRTPSRAAGTIFCGMVLLVATTIFAQKAASVQSTDQVTARMVCELLERFHISQSRINDEKSEQLLRHYLKFVDPQKLYLTQQDVNEFQRYATKLDDHLHEGNVEFAYTVFNRFFERLDQRMKLAHAFIDIKHDFTVDESMVTDTKELAWAKTDKEVNDRWRKRVKYELLIAKLDDSDPKETRDRLHRRYNRLQKTYHDTEPNEILEMYLSALTECFDPHSRYMSPESLQQFRIDMELKLDGIGAALRTEDGYTIVAEVVPTGAAEEDGRLKPGDKIIGVAQGTDGEFVDVVDMKLNKVVRLIRGERGTVVRLKVQTETKETNVYDLTRRQIKLEQAAVKGEIINSGERLGARNGRIGVINIPTFYRDFRAAQNGDENFRSTSRDVEKVLRQFRDAGGVDGVVIDLRSNGGGALSEAIEVTGLFIDKGPVVQVKELDGAIKSHDDLEQGAAYTGPLVVVCNRLSASASEIFAGAIKDYGRGIVIGDTTTHGKGTVQNVMPVVQQGFLRLLGGQDRGALKLTINQFYRVNGDSTQNRGVRSDVVLPSMIDHLDLGESFLENALAFDKIVAAQHDHLRFINPQIVKTLQQMSSQRVAQNEEFQKTLKDIARYEERKNRKSITLNEEKLRAERNEDKADKEKEEEKEKTADADEKPVLPDGAYNDEILQVTLDYIDQWTSLRTVQK